MGCDICGRGDGDLEQLNKQYRTDQISHICNDCNREVTDHLYKIRAMNRKMEASLLKRFMRYARRFK